MKFCPDFATNFRKEWRVSLFQSKLRKQIRKLPKFLKSVKIIHYYSFLFIRLLRRGRGASRRVRAADAGRLGGGGDQRREGHPGPLGPRRGRGTT